MRGAKALGLTVPFSPLARADAVSHRMSLVVARCAASGLAPLKA
jgi:hypothetical protein